MLEAKLERGKHKDRKARLTFHAIKHWVQTCWSNGWWCTMSVIDANPRLPLVPFTFAVFHFITQICVPFILSSSHVVHHPTALWISVTEWGHPFHSTFILRNAHLHQLYFLSIPRNGKTKPIPAPGMVRQHHSISSTPTEKVAHN